MNTCPVCQARVTTPGAVFCQVCGSKLSDMPETPAMEAVPPDRQNTVPPPARSQSAQRIAPQQAQTPNMPHMTAGQNNLPGKKIPWIPILAAGYALLIVIVAVVVIAVVVARNGSGTTAKKKAKSPVTSQNTQNLTPEQTRLLEEQERENQQIRDELLAEDYDGAVQQIWDEVDEEEEAYQNGYEEYGEDMQEESQKLDISFTCLPEMKKQDYSSMKIQINDFILDFSVKRSMTAAEVIEIVEASSLHYTITHNGSSDPYVPDTWVSPNKMSGDETLHFSCEENEELSFRLYFANTTDDVIEIKDAVLTDMHMSTTTPFVWYPMGIQCNGQGLNYDNVPKLFPEYEIETSFKRYRDPKDVNTSLTWYPQDLLYEFYFFKPNGLGYSGDGIVNRNYNCFYYWFYIDETTKEVSNCGVHMYEYTYFSQSDKTSYPDVHEVNINPGEWSYRNW